MIPTSSEDNWIDFSTLIVLTQLKWQKYPKVDVGMEEFTVMQVLAVPCPA